MAIISRMTNQSLDNTNHIQRPSEYTELMTICHRECSLHINHNENANKVKKTDVMYTKLK